MKRSIRALALLLAILTVLSTLPALTAVAEEATYGGTPISEHKGGYDYGYNQRKLVTYSYDFSMERSDALKAIDRTREADPDWYKRNDLLGMMLYIDNFAGTLKGVAERIPYLEKSNVNYIHLMPFLV